MAEEENPEFKPASGPVKTTLTAKFLIICLVGLAVAYFAPPIRFEKPNLESPSPGLEVKSDYMVRPLFNEQYRKVLKEKIDKAREKIFVAMYMIEPSSLMEGEFEAWREDHVLNILDKLARAVDRGVEVEVILSQPTEHNPYKTKSNKAAREYLKEKEVEVKYNQSTTSLHDKIVVIDSKYIFQGSHNWTNAALGYNHEQSYLMEAVDPEKDVIWKKYRNLLLASR